MLITLENGLFLVHYIVVIVIYCCNTKLCKSPLPKTIFSSTLLDAQDSSLWCLQGTMGAYFTPRLKHGHVQKRQKDVCSWVSEAQDPKQQTSALLVDQDFFIGSSLPKRQIRLKKKPRSCLELQQFSSLSFVLLSGFLYIFTYTGVVEAFIRPNRFI